MDKYYQTDGIHTYIVLDRIEMLQDSYEVDMVINNDFNELLSFDFRMLDDRQQMYYKIDGLMAIDELFENDELECKWVIALMKDLVDIIYKLYEYLLSSNDLILELDGIFYNREQQRFHFLYLPGFDTEIRIQIKELIENLLRIVSHKERKDVDFIYGLYERIQQERYNLESMRSYIKSYSEQRAGGIESYIEDNAMTTSNEHSFEREEADEKEKLMGLLFSPDEEIQRKNKNQYKLLFFVLFGITILAGIVWIYMELKNYQQLYHIKPLMIVLILIAVEIFVYMETEKESSGETVETDKSFMPEVDSKKHDDTPETACTTVLQEYGEETELLGRIPKYRLIPDRGTFASGLAVAISESAIYPVPIIIDDSPVTIGRDQTRSDHCILEDTVSRRHAKLYRRKEDVILEDFDSTNGTFVNEVPVLSGHPVTVSEGDYIRFGSVSYHMERESQ